MSIVVVGATGNLGGLAVDALVERGVEPAEIVAAGRNPDRLAGFTQRGMGVARIDLDDAETLASAFRGAQRVLLVSVHGSPQRVAQQRKIIEAVRTAAVDLIVYTSFTHADVNDLHPDHTATEEILRTLDLPRVVLRNGPYFEFYTNSIPFWRDGGQVMSATGDGRISAAAYVDLAAAAATVLTTPGHLGAIYDLGGDEPFTFSELAAELSRQTGESIPYVSVDAQELRARLIAAGVSDANVEHLIDVDRAVARGDFFIDTGDLRRLVGHRLCTLSEAIAKALDHPGALTAGRVMEFTPLGSRSN